MRRRGRRPSSLICLRFEAKTGAEITALSTNQITGSPLAQRYLAFFAPR